MGQFTVCFAHQHAAADSESCLIWAAAAAAQWATRVADVEGVVRLLLPACPPACLSPEGRIVYMVLSLVV